MKLFIKIIKDGKKTQIMVFHTEKESIDFFVSFLEEKGFYSINATQSENQFSYYDIEAELNSKKWRFELKNRSERLKSTDFNDSIMEVYKYKKFKEEKDEYDYGRIVSFFNDCFTISDVFNPIGIEKRMAKKSTYFDDKTIVEKNYITYEQERKFNYD